MRWLRRVAIWWRSRSWLAARVRELEALEAHRLREQRAETERRDAKEEELRQRIAGLLRQADQMDAVHADAVAALNKRFRSERRFGNGCAHRIRKAREWAANLPPGQAAELCALLDLPMPGVDVEESPNAVVV